jgi:hypothetical protein
MYIRSLKSFMCISVHLADFYNEGSVNKNLVRLIGSRYQNDGPALWPSGMWLYPTLAMYWIISSRDPGKFWPNNTQEWFCVAWSAVGTIWISTKDFIDPTPESDFFMFCTKKWFTKLFLCLWQDFSGFFFSSDNDANLKSTKNGIIGYALMKTSGASFLLHY